MTFNLKKYTGLEKIFDLWYYDNDQRMKNSSCSEIGQSVCVDGGIEEEREGDEKVGYTQRQGEGQGETTPTRRLHM